MDALGRRLGRQVLAEALAGESGHASPLASSADPAWLKRTGCVGINLRTTRGLLGALQYVLTLPTWVRAVHLLPVFEPGVVGSLYGMASWRVNAEFFADEWARLAPGLDSVERQLRAFVELCHALGLAVGVDVIPHTDRFSEIALANPWLFEWVRRDDARLLDHRSDLHFAVEEAIGAYVYGSPDPQRARTFFAQDERDITRTLFGDGDVYARNARRDDLIHFLYGLGYETLPATMAPPYRGLELDPSPEAVTVDARGRRWREFRFTHPQTMSRVFGPLTRYKLYGRRDDNRDWVIDHERPRKEVWRYVAAHYRAVVDAYGFDFMRGDMTHVQTRPGGVSEHPGTYYDIHAYVKRSCAESRPHFASFAESFLTADDYMTYGSEAEHLDASSADVALGNLQSYPVDSEAWHATFAAHVALGERHGFAPSFTIFSADKDDPRFDASFDFGSAARYFFAACCPLMPSYSSLGFRQRDLHPTPYPNEFYSKLYVFRYDEGPKATRGPYRWGSNRVLAEELARMDAWREANADLVAANPSWVLRPDHRATRRYVAWTFGGHLCVVSFTSVAREVPLMAIADECRAASLVFSDAQTRLSDNRDAVRLAPGGYAVLAFAKTRL